MKDIKQIGRDVHSVVHAPGVVLGGVGSFFSEIQPQLMCELHKLHIQQHIFFGPSPLGPL